MVSIADIKPSKFHSIADKVDLSAFSYIGAIGKLRLYLLSLDDEHTVVGVLDRTSVIQIDFSEYLRDDVWSVDLVRVSPKFRGFDVAPKVYAFLLKKYKWLVLAAGETQSAGGKQIWNKLARMPNIRVFAKAHDTDIEDLTLDTDDNELVGDIDIYSPNTFVFATYQR